ncbi:ABC multidrug transporter [Aspergillus luchuensis]|uniref:ABC multidrug transporter n=1 Tax=Aspergillus kawachii TaxID=1069201 RepID=A0A146EXE1_ASPKA|nr:ABC multidrug transporter [Aspergillus luchuensis]
MSQAPDMDMNAHADLKVVSGKKKERDDKNSSPPEVVHPLEHSENVWRIDAGVQKQPETSCHFIRRNGDEDDDDDDCQRVEE